MDSQEFWDEHIITHKLIEINAEGKATTIGVGSINMCNRYVADHPKSNVLIQEL